MSTTTTATHDETTSQTTENGATERDAQGRFQTGNAGGPGNPYARRVADLRRAMLMAVSAEDIQAILAAMIAKAKEGNVQAAKLVLSYILGKPEPMADPDRVDAHEWELEKETAAMYADMPSVVQAPPANVPLKTAHAMRPVMGALLQQQMAKVLTPRGKSSRRAEESIEPLANGVLNVLRERKADMPPSANGKKR